MKTLYDDIIRLPHHVLQNHPQMSMHDRAAQFAPFAALTGYEAAVGETCPADRRKARTLLAGGRRTEPPSHRSCRPAERPSGGDHGILCSR